MAYTTVKSKNLNINSVCGHLERLRQHGFFAQPRNLSNVSCHLKDHGHTFDLATLGRALSRMRDDGILSRTVLRDGLLSYIDASNSGKALIPIYS